MPCEHCYELNRVHCQDPTPHTLHHCLHVSYVFSIPYKADL